jgi:uncharacterized OB-fold protein
MADGPITSITTPLRLTYTVTAGRAQSRFLRAMAEGRVVGERCASCNRVYVPPRGACPTCGVLTDPEEVPISDRGTLTTFCVIRIPFEGQVLEPPYVAGSILLDGADLPLFHLVGGVPVDDVRMGMRVVARWADTLGPTLESIRFFEPLDEPDAPFEAYAEHL